MDQKDKKSDAPDIISGIIMAILPIAGPILIILPWTSDYHPAINLIASITIGLILAGIVSGIDGSIKDNNDEE